MYMGIPLFAGIAHVLTIINCTLESSLTIIELVKHQFTIMILSLYPPIHHHDLSLYPPFNHELTLS